MDTRKKVELNLRWGSWSGGNVKDFKFLGVKGKVLPTEYSAIKWAIGKLGKRMKALETNKEET